MKRVILALMVALSATSCCKQAVKISGTAPNVEDSTMLVVVDHTGEVMASTMVMDGAFNFDIKVCEPIMMTLRDEPQVRAAKSFVAEEGEVTITLAETTTVGGTLLNDKLQQYHNLNAQHMEQLTAIRGKMADVNPKDEKAVAAVREEYMNYYNEIAKPETQTLAAILFEENRATPLGAELFLTVIKADTIPDLEQIEVYYKEYPIAKKYASIEKEYTRLVNEQKTAVGAMFTDFTVRNIENTEDVKLSDYVGQGKYILVDFWASWCNPCMAAIPALKEMTAKYGGENFSVLGVNVWDKYNSAIEALEEKQLSWPQLYDADGRAAKSASAYAVRGIPTLILFSPEGEILLRTHNTNDVMEYLQGVL